MAPKDAATVETTSRLAQLEKSHQQHEEHLTNINQQCADLKDGLGRMEAQHKADITHLTETMAAMNESLQGLASKIEMMGKDVPQARKSPDPLMINTPGRLNPAAASLLGSNPPTPMAGQFPDLMQPNGGNGGVYRLPRVEFPKFSGDNVRAWIQKSERFFLLHSMDEQQKVLFASLNFTDAAESWFQTDAVKFVALGWNTFSALIQSRFSEELSENVVGEFKKLCQLNSVKEYQQQFEQLRPLVLLQNPGLSEKYFIDSCIAGLKEDIRHSVQMFNPVYVQSVFALAKLQEATVEFRNKGRNHKTSNFSPFYSQSRPALVGTNQQFSKSVGSVDVDKHQFSKQGNQNYNGRKQLTPSQINERRLKGLCYNCDDAWSSNHKCTSKLFYIAGDSDESPDVSDTASDPAPSDASAPVMAAEVAISLQALSGNSSYQTLMLKGKVKNRDLTMLVDTGSTHNFLDVNTAKTLGCICSEIPSHQVLVAGGSHLTCSTVCRNFEWEIN